MQCYDAEEFAQHWTRAPCGADAKLAAVVADALGASGLAPVEQHFALFRAFAAGAVPPEVFGRVCARLGYS